MKRKKQYFALSGIIIAFLVLLFTFGITERDATWIIRPESAWSGSGAIGIAVNRSYVYVAGYKTIDSIPKPWIAKYRDNGRSATLLWETNLEGIIPSENWGRASDIVVDRLNMYVYVVGTVHNLDIADSSDVFIVVLNTATGGVTRSTILDVNDSGLNDIGEGITEKNGTVYIIGTTLNASGIFPYDFDISNEKSIFYASYITDPADASSLMQVWLRTYDTPRLETREFIAEWDRGSDIVTSPVKEDIYLVGTVNVMVGDEYAEFGSAWVAKVDSEGEIIWTRQYSENLWEDSSGLDIVYGSDRHLNIIGSVRYEALIAEYDPDDGTMLWAETYRSIDNAATAGRGIASLLNGQTVWTGQQSGGLEDNILVKTPTWRAIVTNDTPESRGDSGDAIAVYRNNIYIAGVDSGGIFIGKYRR